MEDWSGPKGRWGWVTEGHYRRDRRWWAEGEREEGMMGTDDGELRKGWMMKG